MKFQPAKVHIDYFPINDFQVQVDLSDRCLVTEPNHLFVSVVSVGKIEVQVSDRVQITQNIDAIVKLYDTFDDPLSLDYTSLGIYDLHEHIFNTNILHVTLGDQNGVGTGEVRYIIRGNDLGETKIVFSSGYGDKETSSSAASIQVNHIYSSFVLIQIHQKELVVFLK